MNPFSPEGRLIGQTKHSYWRGGSHKSEKRYEIFAEYFQFYLWDRRHHPDDLGIFTEEECARHIKVAPHAVVIMPVRNMTVPVEIEVRADAPSAPNLDEWDHIVDVSLVLPSGELEVEGWQEQPIDLIVLEPGSYRVRALFAGLDTLSDDGLNGDDRYRLVIWPAPEAALVVLKQRSVECGIERKEW